MLVNNAAVAPPLRALDDTTRRWRLAVDVNLNGPFYFMYHLGRRMREQGFGHVINCRRSRPLFPAFGRASYTATKLALEGLTQALGLDLAGRVAVNCLRIDLSVWSEGYDATLAERGQARVRRPGDHQRRGALDDRAAAFAHRRRSTT